MGKRNDKSCFTGGELGSLIGVLGNTAAQVGEAINYQANYSQDPYRINFGNVASTFGLGLIPELIKKSKDTRQRNSAVLSATPGNYYTGGPVYQPTLTNPKLGNTTPTVIPQTPQPSVVLSLLGQQAVLPQKSNGTGSYSKSRERFRERFRERSMGGDLQLSNTSVEIQGNPGTVDGNNYPGLRANLDHGEMLKNNFVFSNRLIDRLTGKTFADLSKPVEKGTGNAQKFLNKNPNDKFAANTVAQHERFVQNIATRQEQQATEQGLRSKSRGFAYGGPTDPWYSFVGSDAGSYGNPIDPTTGKPRHARTANYFTGYTPQEGQLFMSLGTDNAYYDPYTKQVVIRNDRGSYVPVKQNRFVLDSQGRITDTTTSSVVGDVNQHLTTKVFPTSTKNAAPSWQFGPQDPFAVKLPKNDGPLLGLGTTFSAPPKTRGRGSKNPITDPLSALRAAEGQYQSRVAPDQNPDQVKYELQKLVSGLQPLDMLQRYQNVNGPGGPISGVQQVASSTPRNLPTLSGITSPTTTSTSTTKKARNNPFTVGDYLQFAEVGSKFAQLAGGAEKEKPYYDSTAITRQSYDPTNALYQNQRNYSAAIRGLDINSVNARRTYANSMLGTKLNSDNQVLTQYKQMNDAALRDYENRASNQRRYNISQTVYTNDINARNRAAYKEAVDVAFTSLGNLGQALNQRKQASDSLRVLSTMYPDVYQRISEQIGYGGQ